jgi:hypothetical protein
VERNRELHLMGGRARLGRQVAQEAPIGRGELFAGTARCQAQGADEPALVGQRHDQAHTGSGDDGPELPRGVEVIGLHNIGCVTKGLYRAGVLHA